MSKPTTYLRIALGIVSISLLPLGIACSTTVTPPQDDDDSTGNPAVSFASDIQPILTVACSGCHSPGGIGDLSGIPMFLRDGESYAMIVNVQSVQQDDLTLVVAGDSAASFFFNKVSSDSPTLGDRMPQFAPQLTDAQITLIRDWIDQGAEDN